MGMACTQWMRIHNGCIRNGCATAMDAHPHPCICLHASTSQRQSAVPARMLSRPLANSLHRRPNVRRGSTRSSDRPPRQSRRRRLLCCHQKQVSLRAKRRQKVRCCLASGGGLKTFAPSRCLFGCGATALFLIFTPLTTACAAASWKGRWPRRRRPWRLRRRLRSRSRSQHRSQVGANGQRSPLSLENVAFACCRRAFSCDEGASPLQPRR